MTYTVEGRNRWEFKNNVGSEGDKHTDRHVGVGSQMATGLWAPSEETEGSRIDSRRGHSDFLCTECSKRGCCHHRTCDRTGMGSQVSWVPGRVGAH